MAKYVNELQFEDFKSNFHTLVNTLNHNITTIQRDVGGMKIDSAVFKNTLKNVERALYGVIGVLVTIAGAILIAVLTKL